MNEIVDARPEEMKPTCRISISKDEAAAMSVDSDVTISVSGKVKSLCPHPGDKEMYEVEIEDPMCEVESTSEEESEEKYDLATVPREELKRHIMKASKDKEDKSDGNE